MPSWCGPNEITLGFADGFGGNNWRLVTTETGRREAALCPSVKELIYTDGQGDLQKSISDIQGLVSQGVNALVVFPDAHPGVGVHAQPLLDQERSGARVREPRASRGEGRQMGIGAGVEADRSG